MSAELLSFAERAQYPSQDVDQAEVLVSSHFRHEALNLASESASRNRKEFSPSNANRHENHSLLQHSALSLRGRSHNLLYSSKGHLPKVIVLLWMDLVLLGLRFKSSCRSQEERQEAELVLVSHLKAVDFQSLSPL